MEHEEFDRRTRLLIDSNGTRRAIIRLVAGGGFGVVAARLGPAKTEAKKGKGGKGKTKGKKKCKSKGKTTICHNGQTLSVSTCALNTLPGATIGACTTATEPLAFCSGKNSCQVTAACNKQGFPTCQCHVAVGSGAPHCGQILLVQDCTATSGCPVAKFASIWRAACRPSSRKPDVALRVSNRSRVAASNDQPAGRCDRIQPEPFGLRAWCGATGENM